MLRVGIVGSGVAGATTAARLLDSTDRIEVSVVERAERLGGRAATGFRNEVRYDYGANYLSSEADRIRTFLDRHVDSERRVAIEEPIYTFDVSESITPGRPASAERWSCRDGIEDLPRTLLSRAGVTIRTSTDVTRIESRDGGWRLRDDAGEVHGPFDVIVLAAPPNACVRVLQASPEVSAAEEQLLSGLRDIPFTSVLSGILRYSLDLQVPYYAVLNEDREHAVGWIARESCKAGHVPEGELLVVQAAPSWSSDHFEWDSDEILDRLAVAAGSILGEPALESPEWSELYRWRHAQPVTEAVEAESIPVEVDDLYLAGDWTAGEGRLAAAVRSGLDVAERILSRRSPGDGGPR